MSLNNSKDLIKSNVIRKPNKLIYSKKYFLIVLLFLLAIFQSNNLFGSAPNADFSVDNTTPVVDETVEFTVDLEGADTWNWNFGDGAVPATADTQGPHDVSYSTPGLKTVFLTASNGNSNDTETKENYIRVFENYYFTGDGDPANTTSWNTEPDGTGEAPTNITGDCLNFIIQNGHTMTTTGTWTLGEYSSIQIEDGVLNEDHAISIDPTGSLQVDDDGRLNHNVNSLSIFTGTETLADNSAINYGDNGEQDIADLNYGNLILSGEATKTLQGDVTVANDLTIENNTTLNTGNNTLSADAAQSTASFSMGDGAEFNVEGAFVSSYDYNNINLDDNSTVSYLDADQAVASAPYGNLVIDGGGTIQGDVRVNTSLNLVDGNLATGAGTNNITIAPDGTISENGGFSETRMIECDGEGNLIKEGDNLSDLEMVYPVGSGGTYSPVEVNSLSGTINGIGSFSVRVKDERAPNTNVNDLQRYWLTETTNIDNSTANLSFQYGDGDVLGNSEDYEPMFSDSENWYDASNATHDEVNYTFATSNASSIDDIIWTLRESNDTYYSYKSGDWDNADNWTTDPSGSLYENENGAVPSEDDRVVILNGRTISITEDTKEVLSLQVNEGGTLDLGGTAGHDFGNVSGQGLLRLSTNNFPDGNFDEFVAADGGTVEYYNIGGDLPDQDTYNNLKITNNTGSDLSLVLTNPNNPTNYTINGDFEMSRRGAGNLTLTMANAARTINLDVYGDFTVGEGCNFLVSNDYASHNINLYGDFTDNGTVNLNNNNDYFTSASQVATLTFRGLSDNIATVNSTTRFWRFRVNKGMDQSYVLSVVGTEENCDPFKGGDPMIHSDQAGESATISIYAGTVRLGENLNVAKLSTNGGYDIGVDEDQEKARLWIDGATVGEPGFIAVYGNLKISSGVLNTNRIVIRYNGSIEVNGGEINVSQIRPSIYTDATPRGSYVQTGGVVNMSGVVNNNNYPRFCWPHASTAFVMTDGELNVSGSTPYGYAVNGGILISSNNVEVTGGTVNVHSTANNEVNFNINSTAPFYNLNVNAVDVGNRTVTVTSQSHNIPEVSGNEVDGKPLIVLNNLRINSDNNPVLDVFDNHVTIGNDFIIDDGSTYAPGNNTTIFNGEGNQTFTNSGNITDGLYNLTLTESADLTLEGTENVFGVRNNLNIESNTTLRDNSKTLTVEGDITNSGTHYRPAGAAGSIQLVGTNDQIITGNGEGKFNNLSVNKGAGGSVELTSKMTINGELRLASNQLFNIADHQLILGENGVVYSALSGTEQSFNANKMIRTNGLNSDEGVKKIFSNTEEYLFPFGFNLGGTNYYMPAYIQFTSEPSQYGSVTSRPVKEKHHLIQETNNALTTYWKNRSSDFDGVPEGSVEHRYFYDAGASNNFVEGTEANYIPGVYLFGTEWETLNDVNRVDQSSNEISFISRSTAEGEYTAGEPSAFAEIPVLYSSGENGDWNNSETWSDIGVGEAGGAGTPGTNTIVVIGDETHNDTVNINNDNRQCGALFIADSSMLDIGTTQGHTFAAIPEETVTGAGTIRISRSDYFPAGDFGDFIGSEGGTIEYYASEENGIDIPSVSESGLALDHYKNLILNNQGNKITMPNTDLTIYENLTIKGTSSFSQTSPDAAWNSLTINGNFNINSGELRIREAGEVKTIKVLGDLNISKYGTFRVDDNDPNYNHILELYGDLINEGVFNVHEGNHYLNTYFKGTNNASISGSGTTFHFYDIIIDKGNSADPLVRLESEITAGITNPFLTLKNGTFRVDNSSLTVTLTDGATDFNIPSTAALSVNSGEVQVAYGGDNADLLLGGRLEVLGGSMYIGDPAENYNNSIEYAAAGTPEIISDGGELHVNGQIRRPTNITSGALNYSQSGGEVTVYGKNRYQNRGLFEITNTNSNFKMSGGTLQFDRPSNTGTTFGDIHLRPDSHDVTGGTLQLGLETSTPDYDFKLSTSTPLWNVNVGADGNNQILSTEVYATTIRNNFTIEGNSQFHANGLDLDIGGDFTNNNTNATPGIDNGGFYAGSNTQKVTFNGDSDQEIAGSGTNLTNFANVTVNSEGSVELHENSTVRINGDLNLSGGELIDGGNSIELTGDVTNTAAHSSPDSDGGIKFTGSENQRISGIGGVFGNIIMDNYSGVSLQDKTTIEGILAFNKGSIYVDDYRLTFGENASIGGAPGVISMIVLNGALSDRGVEKEFGTGASSFTMPIGISGKYTPATYNISTNSDPGSIIVRPVNRRHPAIVDTDNETELAYYWKVDSTGFGDDLELSQTYKYMEDDVRPENGDNDYVVGLYRTHDYKWLDLGDSGDPGLVDETSNNVNIQSVSYVTGDITAGESENFTPPLEIYYSRNNRPNNDWTDPDNWSTEGHDDDDNIATAPPNGNPVIIAEGHTINLNEDDQYSVSVEVNGTLDCGNTVFHDLGTVFGTGKINITSTIEGSFVFPGGSFDEFFETPGTTVEFMGDNTATLPSKPGNFDKPFQNVIFSGTGQKNISADNMKVLGDMTIRGGTTLNNSLYDKNIYILGDWTNENNTEGGFVPGTGTVFFEGEAKQEMNLASTELFYDLTMNNYSDGLELAGNEGIDITKTLNLKQGILYSSENAKVTLSNTSSSDAVKGGNTDSHVDGPLQKLVTEGQSFEFPVGNDGRMGRITLENTSASSSPEYWTARYVNNDPDTDGYLTAEENINAPLTSVSDNEYWIVERPEKTASADISLHYDANSFPDITNDPNTRQLLRLVEYQETPEEWSERGEYVSGSATSGTVSTTEPVTQDDYIFSIGVIGVTAAFDDLSDVEICDNEEIATIPVNLTGTAPWTLTYQTSDGENTSTFTEDDINSSTYDIQLRGSDIGGDGNYDVELVSVSDESGTEGVISDNTVNLTVLQTFMPEISGPESVGTDETRQYSTPDNGSSYTWSWVDETGGTIQSSNSNETNIDFDQGSGAYTLEIVEESSTGCLATDQITIDVLDVPVPDITPKDANLCEGSTVTYSTPENSGNEYRWTVTGGTCNTADYDGWRTTGEGGNSIEVTWNTPGEGTIEVEERVGTDGPVGTASQDYVIYKEPDPFTPSLSEDPICEGSSTNIVIESSESGITYQLHLNSDDSEVGESVPGDGGKIELPTGSLSENMEFYVTAYNLGCEISSETLEVDVLNEPEVYDITPLVTDTAICEGDAGVEIGLDDSETGVVYELYVDGSTAGSTVNGTGNEISFGEQTDEGIYTVEAYREEVNTCTKIMNGSIDLTVYPLPEADAGLDTSVCYGNSIQLEASGGTEYSWEPETGLDDPNISKPEFTPESNPEVASIDSTYQVTVTDDNGCQATDEVEITILRRPETGDQYYVPNEFNQ